MDEEMKMRESVEYEALQFVKVIENILKSRGEDLAGDYIKELGLDPDKNGAAYIMGLKTHYKDLFKDAIIKELA